MDTNVCSKIGRASAGSTQYNLNFEISCEFSQLFGPLQTTSARIKIQKLSALYQTHARF